MPCTLSQETIDGDLAVRVFGLLPVVDSGYHQGRYGERSRQRLDLAILSLFQSFRKVYIGEQVMHSSKVSAAPFLPSLRWPEAHLCWHPYDLLNSSLLDSSGHPLLSACFCTPIHHTQLERAWQDGTM